MLKKLSYKQRILLNLIPIAIGFILWFFNVGVPYFSDEHRLKSIMQNNFSGNAEVIYTLLEEEDEHEETHYILTDGVEYGYLNIYNYRNGNTVRGGPTRNLIRLFFEDELSIISVDGEMGVSDETPATVIAVCLDENVETLVAEYHNGDIIVEKELTRQNDKVFSGTVIIPEMRLGMEHWDAELYNGDFTAKGYDKEGNLIRINKCQNQRMEERKNVKDR
ncbi:MAG: hypothetical protein IJN37_02095 [Clostridia bacterium]|nr:hypothetical protein [Clostridia bacterium]